MNPEDDIVKALEAAHVTPLLPHARAVADVVKAARAWTSEGEMPEVYRAKVALIDALDRLDSLRSEEPAR